VYEHRPLQCQNFPFWAANLTDAQAWRHVGESCRGVNQGRLWSQEEVLACVARSEQEPLLDVGD
jgi:Fe-S-cluster containining protein